MHKFSRHRGPRQYQPTMQRIQACFGLTQQELADVLGVSRGVLTMNGRGGRSLPPEAWTRLLQFHQALPVAQPDAEPAPAPAPSLPTPAFSADERQELDLRRRSLALKAVALGEERARRHTRLAQARLRLEALPGLRASFPADDEVAQALLKVWQNQAAATLRNEAGPAALLALRLRVLAFEVSETAKLLEEPEE